jgi:hypothetical protein
MLCSTVAVISEELVLTDVLPDGRAGVIFTKYIASSLPFGGGVHFMLTVEFPIRWMVRELL